MEHAPSVGRMLNPFVMPFFKCKYAKEVWRWWKECPIVISAENQDFSDIALRLLSAGTARDLKVLVVTAWAIWYNRNQWVHEAEKRKACQIREFTSGLLQDYKEATKFFRLGPSS